MSTIGGKHSLHQMPPRGVTTRVMALACSMLAIVLPGCQSREEAQPSPSDNLLATQPEAVVRVIVDLRLQKADVNSVRDLLDKDSQACWEVDLTLAKSPGAALRLAAQLPHVRRLNLHGAELATEDFALLKSFPELQWLDLSQTSLDDSRLLGLQNMRNLQFLILWGTNVGNDGIAVLAALPHLRKLDVSATHVTGAGLNVLTSLDELQELFIESTLIDDESARALQERLPHTLITH